MSISIWEKETYYAPQDIIIAGAGLMGLWTALELKQNNSNLSITIVEKGTTPMGASTRNAGFACFGSATELLQDAATMGEDKMLQIMEQRYKGIQKIRNHFTDKMIGYDACGGYECINNITNINDKLSYLNNLLQPIVSDANCFTISDAKLVEYGLQGFHHLIENKHEGGLHSGKLVAALTKKVQALGVTILYATEIKSFENKTDYVEVQTNHASIKAKCFIVCTNAFTNTLFPDLNITPARGQVILTSPINNLSLKGTFHFDEGFYYWRNLGNSILLGGARNQAFEEEQTTSFDGSDKIKNVLKAFLQTHIASQYNYTIEHEWSGIMGFTADKQPLVKVIKPNIIAAIACNGMGVALTPVIAENAAALALQQFK